MLPWIIQMSVISLILIVLVHYLFTFFKTNLTIPKVKDLVNKPQKQYEALYDTMKETTIRYNVTDSADMNTNINMNDTLRKDRVNTSNESTSMKNELKNYLKELSDSKKTSNTLPFASSSNSSSTSNVNNMGSLLTSETLMSGASFSSGSYSAF